MPPEHFTADWFNSLPNDQRAAVLSGGLGNAVMYAGLQFALPFWWRTVDASGNVSLRNGSSFLVNCGRGIFAVTAAHVFTDYCRARREAAVTLCQLGNAPFDPETNLIACDEGIDVATFRVSETDAAAIGKPVLTGDASTWPPPPADEGNFAVFAGFPAQSRGMNPTGSIFAAGPYFAMPPITRITDRQITCRFEREKMLDLSGQGLPPVGYDIGGVSGGPLLIPAIVGPAIWLRLGGVVTQAAPGELMEGIVATRVDYILPDGRLTRM